MLQIPAFTYLLDTDFRFNAMLCSNLDNENYNAGHTKISRGSHLAQRTQVSYTSFRDFDWLSDVFRAKTMATKRSLITNSVLSIVTLVLDFWLKNITRQQMELESYSNLLKIRNLVVQIWNKTGNIGFEVHRRWRHYWSRFKVFGWRRPALGPNRKG